MLRCKDKVDAQLGLTLSDGDRDGTPHQHDALTHLCYAREHSAAHLHPLFHPKNRLSAHLDPAERSTRVQTRVFMDAQIARAYGPVSDLHPQDPRTFRR